MKKITIERIRTVQWDKSNKWEFELEGLNEKFGGWTSTTSLEIGFFGVTTEALGSTGTEYISGHTYPTLTISYVDSEDLKITQFFTKWMQDCVSEDGYEVETVADAAKDFNVFKTLSTNETKHTWQGKVIPSGNITYTGDSDGSVPIYQVNFMVVAGSLKW